MSTATENEITLRRVWRDYQQCRDLKPVTLKNYNQRLALVPEWLDIPITALTKDMMADKHRSIHGHAMANSTMRTIRALLRFAHIKYDGPDGRPLLKTIPTNRLNELRLWHRDRQRRTIIHPQQMPTFFAGLQALPNHTARDLILLLLLTGMRLGEGRWLTWDRVDLETRIITLENTKQSGDPITIPMSSHVWKILAIRRIRSKHDRFVFPGKKANKPFSAAWSSLALSRKISGVPWSPHWLRRTFCTVADDLNIKSEVVRALINHQQSGDLTESYTVRSVERLRAATEMISEAIMRYGGYQLEFLPQSGDSYLRKA